MPVASEKRAPERKFYESSVPANDNEPESRATPGENDRRYDGNASGPRVYAYAGNDPINNTDPTGLWCTYNLSTDADGNTSGSTTCSYDPVDLPSGGGGGGNGEKGDPTKKTTTTPPPPPKNSIDPRLSCTGNAYTLAGNPANVGKTGFPGVTVTNGSAAVIPSQFTGVPTAGPFMRAIGASSYGTVTGSQGAASGVAESFNGITQPIGYAALGTAQQVQSMLMARDPGALIIEIVGGQDLGKDANIYINMPNLGQGCPAGTS